MALHCVTVTGVTVIGTRGRHQHILVPGRVRLVGLPEYVVHALLDGVADDEPVHHRRPLLTDAVNATDGLYVLV